MTAYVSWFQVPNDSDDVRNVSGKLLQQHHVLFSGRLTVCLNTRFHH